MSWLLTDSTILTYNCFCFLGKRVGFQTAQLFLSEELEALVLPDVVRACEEAGKAKGEEVFPGEFGGNVGAEAGVKAGKEAAIAKVVEMVQVNPKLEEDKLVFLGGNLKVSN